MALLLLVIVAAMSLVTALLFGLDKVQAKRGARRVPEARLLLAAALFGAPGAWFAASLFRHKTRKRSFQLRLVVASAICAGLCYGVLEVF